MDDKQVIAELTAKNIELHIDIEEMLEMLIDQVEQITKLTEGKNK